MKRECESMFPMDVLKNTKFTINYFTSNGLGVITEAPMREYLKVGFFLENFIFVVLRY
jgi:pre-mRNA-splicing factor CWC22